jgi:choline dehydrogenase-like flavoprotein
MTFKSTNLSTDPTTPPVIQPNYGGHEADQILLAAALRWTDGATKNKHLAEYLQGRTWPPPEYDLNQLQQGVRAVEEVVLGEYHASSSVSMGDALDSRLRVKGAQNLRVVDASIFPGNVSGNIASTVYALAEKAADLIKEDIVRT